MFAPELVHQAMADGACTLVACGSSNRVGAMMALEVMREIVGFGEGLVGRLVLFDALAMRFETLSYGRDPDNPLNGDAPAV